MRSIDDPAGGSWDVAVGKASYGNLVLLFSRRGENDVRQVAVAAGSRLQAERLLQDASEEALRAKLAAATPWGEAAAPGGGGEMG